MNSHKKRTMMVKSPKRGGRRAVFLPFIVGFGLAAGSIVSWYGDKLDYDLLMKDASDLLSTVVVANTTNGATMPKTSDTGKTNNNQDESASALTAFDVVANSDTMKQWRQKIRQTCAAATTGNEVRAISNITRAGFTMPSTRVEQPRGDAAVRACKFIVLDFGANIGDSCGHVLDSGMPECEHKKLKTSSPTVHFDVKTRKFEETKRRNPLTRHLVRMMAENKAGPEDYCYYGIEGNRVFTDRLREIEDFVMAIEPRPIQHVHFFTESVGAGSDGPTKLYLDTINEKQNYWGSSIFANHQDVRKSAKNDKEQGGSGEKVAADVMGYTIGSLMKKTLKAFQSDAPESEKTGNHLVLKVDIEGGEYPLLNEAHKEGTLCQFVKMGNKADLFIEFHSQRVTGPNPLASKRNQIKDDLTKCGVNFRNLAAWWA